MNLTVTITTSAAPWWQNWQLWTGIASVVAGFAAFTVGSLVKYWFDLRMDRRREQVQARGVALALRAEGLSIARQFYIRKEAVRSAFAIRAAAREAGEASPSLLLPDTLSVEVYRSQIDHLGTLPPELSAEVINTFSSMVQLYQGLPIGEAIVLSGRNLDFLEKMLADHYGGAMSVLLPLLIKLSDFAQVPPPEIELEEPDAFAKRAKRTIDKLNTFLQDEMGGRST